MERVFGLFRRIIGQKEEKRPQLETKFKTLQTRDVFSDRDGEVLMGLVETQNLADSYNYGLRIKVNNVGEAKSRLRVLIVEHRGELGFMSEFVADERESSGLGLPFTFKTEKVGWSAPLQLTRDLQDSSLVRLRGAAQVHGFSYRQSDYPKQKHLQVIREAVEKGIEYYQTQDRGRTDEWASTGLQTLRLAKILLTSAKETK